MQQKHTLKWEFDNFQNIISENLSLIYYPSNNYHFIKIFIEFLNRFLNQ